MDKKNQKRTQKNDWFSVQRKYLFSELWLAEPFTRGQAWLDLIGLARFQDGFIFKRGIKVEIKRGQVPYSKSELADRWQWSRGKVRRFLMDLQNEHQIDQQKNNVTTLISIINYDRYQNGKPANRPANEPANEPAEFPEPAPTEEHSTPNNDTTMINNETTTTTERGCSCENNSEKDSVHQGNEPAAVDSKPDTLTEKEWNRKPVWMEGEKWEYIILEGNRMERAEGFRSTRAAWENGMAKRDRDGLLNISGLDELRAQAKKFEPHPSYIDPREELEWTTTANNSPWEMIGISESEWATEAMNGYIKYNGVDSCYTMKLDPPASDKTKYIHVWPDGRIKREGELVY